jgi:hypothetical protein
MRSFYDYYYFFCNKKIENYQIGGIGGEICFFLDPEYFDKKEEYIEVKYNYYNYHAFSKEYMKECGFDDDCYEAIEKNEFKEFPENEINLEFLKKNISEKALAIPLLVKFQHSENYGADLFKDGHLLKETIIDKECEKYNLSKIYNIVVPFFDRSCEEEECHLGPTEFFIELKNFFEMNLDKQLLRDSDYISFLITIGEMGFNYNRNNNYSLKDLNELRKKINKFDCNPISILLNDLFYSLTETISEDKKIMQCQNCLDFISYKSGKKFCSLRTENKDCAKASANKRSYKKRLLKNLQ